MRSVPELDPLQVRRLARLIHDVIADDGGHAMSHLEHMPRADLVFLEDQFGTATDVVELVADIGARGGKSISRK